MSNSIPSRREALKQISLLGVAGTLSLSAPPVSAQNSRTEPLASKKVLYEELIPDEFVERINECPIAFLPLGTLEWHGLHLPLGADGIQSREFFVALAKKMGGIVLPMLFLGPDLIKKKSEDDIYGFVGMECLSFEEGHMQQFEGSAYHVDEELFNKMLEAILWNLSRAGFKIVVAHGHGPSTNSFGKIREKFEVKFGLKLFTLWELGGNGREGIQTDHAAHNETSLVLGFRPDLVKIEKIFKEEDMIGIGGSDPRIAASPEEGRRIIDMNLTLAEEKLKKHLSEIRWKKREIKYTHGRKLHS